MTDDSVRRRIVEQDAIIAAHAPGRTAESRLAIGRARHEKAMLLAELGETDAALATLTGMGAGAVRSDGVVDRWIAARTATIRGWVLSLAGDNEVGIAAYDEAFELADADTDPGLRFVAFEAQHRKALLLRELGRYEDSAVVVGDLINRHWDDPPEGAEDEIVDAGLLFVTLLGDLGQIDDEIDGYARLVALKGDNASPAVRRTLAAAQYSRAAVLGERARYDEALQQLDSLMRYLEQWPESEERSTLVAEALNQTAFWLRKTGEGERANAVLQGIVAQFGSAAAGGLAEQVDAARRSLQEA